MAKDFDLEGKDILEHMADELQDFINTKHDYIESKSSRVFRKAQEHLNNDTSENFEEKMLLNELLSLKAEEDKFSDNIVELIHTYEHGNMDETQVDEEDEDASGWDDVWESDEEKDESDEVNLN